MFSNFEPLRGLEPRTHALRMRNRVLKISELDAMRKNLYRNKTKKNKLLYLLFRFGFGRDGLCICGFIFAGFALAWSAWVIGRYGGGGGG